MAINGAGGIRPLGPEIRVTPARAAGSNDSSKREQGTPARASAQGARARSASGRRLQLPEFSERKLSFRRDEELNRVIVEVIDSKTHEVIRTIPPEDLVKILKNIRAAHGAFLDEEA